MNASRIFIVRPVMTTLLMAALTLFGIISYFSLPVNDLPAVDFPTISVTASLPGASPETMASAVATPLEKQFSSIAGLDNMNSSSQKGQTSITLQFDLTRKIDGAAEDVQAAIVAARTLLPTSMPTPPTFRKVNPADMPILYIALSSPTLPLYQVDEYAENMVAPRISMIDGVAQVQVYGSQTYAPHVQVDPRRLAAYGIGIDEVASAIQSANVNMPTGTLYGKDKAFNVVANGQLFNAEAFRPVVVTYRNGSPVRLQDIGEVIDSVQTDKVASWYNNTRAVILAVQRQPNTNTIQIVDRIKQLMPGFQALIPGSVKLEIFFDRSESIRKSVGDVKATLLTTVVLVIGVIFFFLGDLPSTVIASLAVPISILGSFAAMKFFDFTINNISLMALTLSVGFVIDDAIVVLENIVRHIEMGESPREAALNGSREIGFTVVSMTLSLVAVFIPILLMGGIIGRLFFQFGVTISVAVVISCMVSLSLTPMMCSRFLRRHDPNRRPGLVKVAADLFYARLVWVYEKTLKIALNNRAMVVIMFVAMVVATGYMLGVMPKGFMPTEDTGQLFGTTEAQDGISFDEMVRHQKKVAAIVAKDPNVKGFMSSVGAGGPGGTANQGRIILILKPLGERKMKADDVIAGLRKKLSNIPGIKLFMQAPPSIRIGGRPSKALYQLSLSGSNSDQLYAATKDLQKELAAIPALVDVNTDLELDDLKLNVKIDRDKCAQLGVSIQAVQDALNSAYSARQISVIYTATNQYWVVLEVEPRYYQDPSMMSWLRVRSNTGQLIPLDTVASMERSAGALEINHVGQFPATTISFNVRPNMSLSEAVDSIKDTCRKTLPPDVAFKFQGNAQVFESSTKSLGSLLIISILVIYILLGILYESFVHPLTILSGLPSAGLGAVITLLLFHKDLDIYGYLGLIMLIGIVKKNAIMMIDYALETERSEGLHPEDAIYRACLVRFRPIMMTTIAAILGSFPIAIGMGASGDTRQPLGLAIIGGLLLSQVVTLYITPIFYLYFEQLSQWWMAKRRKHGHLLGGVR